MILQLQGSDSIIALSPIENLPFSQVFSGSCRGWVEIWRVVRTEQAQHAIFIFFLTDAHAGISLWV
jgi:hypothetical protein